LEWLSTCTQRGLTICSVSDHFADLIRLPCRDRTRLHTGWIAPKQAILSLLQLYRFLGAGFHAESTSPASIRVDDKRLLSAMYEQFEPSHQGEFGFLFRRDGPDQENVVRTNRNARSRCFATHGVDDRHHNARIELAIGVRFCHRPPHATGTAKPIIQHAPQNASAFALAVPIPCDAPLTTAALFFNVAMILTFLNRVWLDTVGNNVSETEILCR
jgi:hypothetical protein